MRMRRPSPAMAVAVAALVLTAGGTATATAGVLITSADLEDNTIRSVDLHDETIGGRDVRNGALSGVDVARNSLTGADVRESSLGMVPDANRLDGVDSTQFVRKAEALTRHLSCAGTAFENAFSWNDYAVDGSLKYGLGTSPFVLFRCSVDVPDGARVTEVSFAVKDTHPTQDVQCSMWRSHMTAAIGDSGPPMAYEVMTSGTPGDVRISDTTIDHPMIDNGKFSYSLQCWVGNDSETGLYGAVVTYRVTGG
jgi:hypothetical protein